MRLENHRSVWNPLLRLLALKLCLVGWVVFMVVSTAATAGNNDESYACLGKEFAPAQVVKQGAYVDSGAFQGGIITDGADIREIRWQQVDDKERIVIHVFNWNGLDNDYDPVPFVEPCHFRLESETHPHTLRLSFGGARDFTAYRSLPALNTALADSGLVHSIYPVMVLDDSAGELGIILKKRVRFEVYELHDPARIVIDLVAGKGQPELPPIFSLRSRSGISVEEGGHLREDLQGITQGRIRQLVDRKGEPLVEAGIFPTLEQAQEKCEVIRKNLPDSQMFIELRNENDLPEYRP
jgi:hypothetical protein